MALDSYERLWKGLQNRCPLAGPFLCQDWIRWAFREIIEKRKWGWSIKRSQFVFPAITTAGTVSVTNNNNQVVGVGTNFTSALIGQQFRTSNLTPIYDVIAVTNPTNLTLSDVWGSTSLTNTGYKIYLAYVIPPTDFHSFISIYDPNFSWQLWTNVRQDDLNMYDAQRASQGTPYVVADYDFTSLALGGATITPPVPRFEIWPHVQSAYVLPFLYESRQPDLDDAGVTLPRFIPGNVLMEGGLAQAAKWPGPDSDHKNPMFNLALSQLHEKKFQDAVRELERQDDEVYKRDIWYESGPVWPMAPLPFPVNSSYLQLHAIVYALFALLVPLLCSLWIAGGYTNG